jgi:purine/pyrimidine-nucleoside phosphorylase
MPNLPTQFTGVTVVTKANVYFDGKVVSYSVLFPDGTKKTLGLIQSGSYHFNTGAPERMEIVAGTCRVTLDGQREVRTCTAGQAFDVPGKSGFTIEAPPGGLCEYICSFLGA